jgi:hypothetical protein
MTRRAAILFVCGLTAGVLPALAALAPPPAWAAPTLTVGPNVNVSKAAGNQNEAGIAVDPTNPQHLFMAMNTDASAFPDGLLGAVSTDGGATWTTRHLADGVTDTLTEACCDPKVSWDSYGNLFLTYLNGTTNGVIVARSTDGGATFTQLTSIAGSDQPSVATGANSVWVTFEDGSGIEAAGASVTGLGLTGAFSAKQLAPGSSGGNFGDIAIGPTGQVLVTYEKPDGGQGPATLYVNLDADGLGAGGFGPQIAATTTNVGGFDFIPPQPDRSVDAEGNLAWDRTGGAHNGRVYLAYTDETPNESNNTDIYVRHSDDNGSTWSAPVKVNDDATTRSQFNPDISLDPTNGNIGITFHDSRNDSGSGAGDTDGVANTDAQRWGTVSTDGGATFLPNVKISAGTSHQNNLPGPGFADIDFGDYDTSTFFGNHLYSAWADNSNSTGDNPQGSLHQMDVYVAKVTFSTATPTTLSTQASPSTLLGGPLYDRATLSGGSSPTGTITFKLYGPNDTNCTGPVAFSSPVTVSGNGTYQSAPFTPSAVGTYRWTADYSGDGTNSPSSDPCNSANESATINPFAPPPCTQNLTGDVAGPLTVNAGDSVCVNNARVTGPITVNPGGALTVTASKITNGIVATAPGFLSICGSQVSAPTANPSQGIVESGASVPLRVGDPANGCALNSVSGGVSFTSNTGGLTFGANQVAGSVAVNNNTLGTEVIKANNITGTLACSGNNPPPINAGQANSAGAETGQCAGL